VLHAAVHVEIRSSKFSLARSQRCSKGGESIYLFRARVEEALYRKADEGQDYRVVSRPALLQNSVLWGEYGVTRECVCLKGPL